MLVLGGVWVASLVYTGGYLFGYDLFPVTRWLRSLYEPLYKALFGGAA